MNLMKIKSFHCLTRYVLLETKNSNYENHKIINYNFFCINIF